MLEVVEYFGFTYRTAPTWYIVPRALLHVPHVLGTTVQLPCTVLQYDTILVLAITESSPAAGGQYAILVPGTHLSRPEQADKDTNTESLFYLSLTISLKRPHSILTNLITSFKSFRLSHGHDPAVSINNRRSKERKII